MSSVTTIRPSSWLKNAPFDLALLLGTTLLALLCAALFAASPAFFIPVYLMDLWGLGYPHVISTFTRFSFRADEPATDRFLLQVLPLLCLAGILGLYFGIGAWLIGTVYFYWQWFHTMRQGYGIARIYQRKCPDVSPYYDKLCMALVYAIPTWGILHWSHLNPHQFLFLELRCIPVPAWLVQGAAILSCVIFALWIIQQVLLLQRGKMLWTHSLFILTHTVVFGLGYLWLSDINAGFVITNVWHNSQYLLMVWMANNKDFSKNPANEPGRKLDGLPSAPEDELPEAVVLPTSSRVSALVNAISRDKNMFFYYGFCFGLALVVYSGIHQANAWLIAIIPVSVIGAQTINFHHFIVDTVIWKRRTGFQKSKVRI